MGLAAANSFQPVRIGCLPVNATTGKGPGQDHQSDPGLSMVLDGISLPHNLFFPLQSCRLWLWSCLYIAGSFIFICGGFQKPATIPIDKKYFQPCGNSLTYLCIVALPRALFPERSSLPGITNLWPPLSHYHIYTWHFTICNG